MKTVIIIGSTRQAARERLEKIASGNGIRRREFYDEGTRDDRRIVAIGGAEDDVCWLRAAGFDVEIVTVGAVSEAMQRRIGHVRSANGRDKA